MSDSWAEYYLQAGIELVTQWLRRRRKEGGAAADDGLAGDRRLSELRQRGRALGDETLPLSRLSTRLQLTATEELVVWLLLAHELDNGCRELIRECNSEHCADVAADSVRQLVYGRTNYATARRELAPAGPLSRWCLVDRTDGNGAAAGYRQTLAINPRVVALACGETTLDSALDAIVLARECPIPWEAVVVDGATRTLALEAFEGGRVLATGARSSGRRTLLSSLAAHQGRRVLEVACASISMDFETAGKQLRTVVRECRLWGLLPLLLGIDELATDEHRLQLVERTLGHPFLATASRPLDKRWLTPPSIVSLAPPSGADRAQMWRRALPELDDNDRLALAERYPIVPGITARAAAIVRRNVCARPPSRGELSAAVDAACVDRLSGVATRVHVSQNWDDLVLPTEQRDGVCELLARLNHRTRVYEQWGLGNKVGRGLGVVGLFSGPPGTGKTMTAGLVAQRMGVPLYRVETSSLVSKYIGETQKNLARLFDAVEGSHVILLFDEADSLFGKRTEVRGSNDRHANQETNFLLQRLESFTGACFLTTNHEAALDDAFRRRIAAHIRFPTPDVAERKLIWERLIASDMPISGPLRLDVLAERYALSGGHIKNAVVRAAFFAADRNRGLDHPLLAHAANLECEAIGKVVESPSTL